MSALRSVLALVFVSVFMIVATPTARPGEVPATGTLIMDSIAKGEWLFEGEVGERVSANVEHAISSCTRVAPLRVTVAAPIAA